MLVNHDIVKEIYDMYYVKDNVNAAQTMSSHWKCYSDRFDVQIDENGSPTTLHGTGFGEVTGVKDMLSKLMQYLTIISYLFIIPNKIKTVRLMILSLKLCKRLDFSFTYDCFRQACTLALLSKHIEKRFRNKDLRFIVIGDGYGILSCLAKDIYPEASIVLVDIGKVLIFQAYYCQKAHSKFKHHLIRASQNVETENLQDYDFIYCPSEYLEEAGRLDYDIAINVASFQEMNWTSVNGYFQFLRKRLRINNLFYCANREHKILIGGESTEFQKYPWSINDKHLIDGYCPWHKYFLTFSRVKNGPKVFGFNIPFINYLDGKILHRLTILSRIES